MTVKWSTLVMFDTPNLLDVPIKSTLNPLQDLLIRTFKGHPVEEVLDPDVCQDNGSSDDNGMRGIREQYTIITTSCVQTRVILNCIYSSYGWDQ